ncbi:MAG: xdhA [Vampirovibrio sp.]|jgi:xanthine dehydrogenase small subunit|nr:xdhA [Vampirovibrio sp.]
MRNFIRLYINGQPCQISGNIAFLSLANYLRYERQATGTKIVCEEGDCGACSVLLGRMEGDQLVYRPINSCIQFLYQLDCTHIITVEGLKLDGKLNPVQEAMVDEHGAQCGYCTPGFVVTMCSLLDKKPAQVSCQDLKDGLTGNLCRCTGYEPILRAGMSVELPNIKPIQQLYPSEPMIRDFQDHIQEDVRIEAGVRLFFCPASVESAVTFKAEHAGTVVVSGGTDIGVICNKRGIEPSVVMSTTHLPALEQIESQTDADGQTVLTVGARVTLSVLEAYMKDRVPELHKILNVFGAPQIKNAGTLAGNIANGSPIGDSLPFLMVMDAEVELMGVQGTRIVNMNRLYKGYRTLDMQPDELITRIRIPLPTANETLRLYKVSKRKHLDISAFTAAIRLMMEDESITSARLAYGGVGPVVLRLPETEAFLVGKPMTEATFREAGKIARQEVTPISDVRGSQAFRLQLAENILMKFYFEVAETPEAVCP